MSLLSIADIQASKSF